MEYLFLKIEKYFLNIYIQILSTTGNYWYKLTRQKEN